MRVVNKIQYSANKLTVFEKTIEFNYNVLEIKQNNHYIFVVLEIPTNGGLGEKELNNVYAINFKGEIQWEINNNSLNDSEFQCLPMVGIDIGSNEEVFVTDFMGRKFEVNQENGGLSNMKIVK